MLSGKSVDFPAANTTCDKQWKLGFRRLEELPMFPTFAAEALEVANQPDGSLRDLARTVQRDMVLTAGVLKLANSSLYCTGHEVTTVEQAVVRLGVVRCRHAILAVGMRSLWHEGIRRLTPRWAQFLWHHSLLTANIALGLSHRLRLPFQGEEIVAGLAHDLGRMVLAMESCTVPLAQHNEAFLETRDILRQERDQLGADHCSIGAWFLQMNHLPAFLIDVAEYHHYPERAVQHAGLVHLIAVAEELSNYWYATAHKTHFAISLRTREWLQRHFGEHLGGGIEMSASSAEDDASLLTWPALQQILTDAAREAELVPSQ